MDTIENITERTALTKLRLSNHELLIEKGRHKGLSESERLCPFCTDHIESEEHFAIKCRTFTPLREELYNKITHIFPFFLSVNESDKFKLLMKEPEAAHITAEYLHKMFETRKLLVEKHKIHD